MIERLDALKLYGPEYSCGDDISDIRDKINEIIEAVNHIVIVNEKVEITKLQSFMNELKSLIRRYEDM